MDGETVAQSRDLSSPDPADLPDPHHTYHIALSLFPSSLKQYQSCSVPHLQYAGYTVVSSKLNHAEVSYLLSHYSHGQRYTVLIVTIVSS